MTKQDFLASLNGNTQAVVNLSSAEIKAMIDSNKAINSLADYDELFTYVKHHGVDEFKFKAKQKGISVTYELVNGGDDTVVELFFPYGNLTIVNL